MILKINNNIVKRNYSQFKFLITNNHNINYIKSDKLLLLKLISYLNIETIVNEYSSPSLSKIN